MRILDVTKLKCPLPILKLSKELAQMASGEQLQLIADDSATLHDIPAFLRQTGHQLINQNSENNIFNFLICKK